MNISNNQPKKPKKKAVKLFSITDKHYVNTYNLKNLLLLICDMHGTYFLTTAPGKEDFDLIACQYNRIQRLLETISYMGDKILVDMNKTATQLTRLYQSMYPKHNNEDNR